MIRKARINQDGVDLLLLQVSSVRRSMSITKQSLLHGDCKKFATISLTTCTQLIGQTVLPNT